MSIVNSVFSSNRWNGYGGGLYLDGIGDLRIVNSTFRRNRGTFGGGIYMILRSWSVNADISNTLLWGNKPVDAYDLAIASFGGSIVVDVDRSDIGDMTGPFADLGGNIDADPRLTGDLHLRPDSPAIDAGTCTGAPATDFEGDTRPTGSGCDMGADEFVP